MYYLKFIWHKTYKINLCICILFININLLLYMKTVLHCFAWLSTASSVNISIIQGHAIVLQASRTRILFELRSILYNKGLMGKYFPIYRVNKKRNVLEVDFIMVHPVFCCGIFPSWFLKYYLICYSSLGIIYYKQ